MAVLCGVGPTHARLQEEGETRVSGVLVPGAGGRRRGKDGLIRGYLYVDILSVCATVVRACIYVYIICNNI